MTDGCRLNDFREAFAQLPDDQRRVLTSWAPRRFPYEDKPPRCGGCALGTIKSRAKPAARKAGPAELMQLDKMARAMEMHHRDAGYASAWQTVHFG